MVSLVGIAGSSDLNRTPLDQMLWIILFLTLSGIALTIGRFFVCLRIHRVEDVKNESLDAMQDVKFIKNGENVFEQESTYVREIPEGCAQCDQCGEIAKENEMDYLDGTNVCLDLLV